MSNCANAWHSAGNFLITFYRPKYPFFSTCQVVVFFSMIFRIIPDFEFMVATLKIIEKLSPKIIQNHFLAISSPLWRPAG